MVRLLQGRPFALILAACLIALSGAAAVPAAATIAFQPPVNYPKLGAGPVTAADLDGDGKPDLAVIGGGGGRGGLSLFYGNGDGTFQASVDYSLGDGLSEVVAADLNGDGRLDFVLANSPSNQVAVMLNLGSRHFSAPVYYPVGTTPIALTTGDFNEDGRLDLAVSNHHSNNLCILLNQGDGTFGAPVFYPGGSYTARVVSGDFNRDGHLDLAMSNYVSGNVLVYTGDGTGHFSVTGDYGVGSYPAMIVTHDFNGDGLLDLATANTFSHTISILFGNGDGTFRTPTTYGGNTYPHLMAAADLDGDGDVDLATPNNGTSYFSVLENDGSGAFLPAVQIPSGGSNTRTLCIADFNRDGRPDVAVGNESTNNVSVFLNSSTGPTPPFPALPAGHAAAARPVQDPVSGHWYLAVRVANSLTWDEARAAAQALYYSGRSAHLATITSADESDFIIAQLPQAIALGSWLGGYQPDPSSPRDAGWQWVTGEPFAFTHWDTYEPNDFSGPGSEDALHFWPTSGGRWNDIGRSRKLGGYLVEFDGGAPLTLTLSPGAVVGGQAVAGSVTLAQPAGPDGVVLTLTSSNSALAGVPASVTVAPGTSTATFSATTAAVLLPASATISVVGDAGSDSVTLQVAPPPQLLPPGHTAVSPPVLNPANGHWYQVIRVTGGIGWIAAFDAARYLTFAGYPGHLATLTSAAEAQFVSNSVVNALGGGEHVWLGAYQYLRSPDYSEPAGGWRWVTAEPFSYGNWIPGEPNNAAGSEHVVELQKERGDLWNDLNFETALGDYLVEYEAPGLAAFGPLVVTPGVVVAGAGATGRVTLAQPAGPGGAVVALTTSSSAAADVPEFVTVPAGATSATFPITTGQTEVSGTVGIYATYINRVVAPLGLLPLPFAPGELTAQAKSPNEIDLTWTDHSAIETAFAIWRKSPTSDWSRIAVVAPNTTAYADRGLTPNATYTYRVRAIGVNGASAWTGEAPATTLNPPPTAPSSLAAIATSAIRVDLAWHDNSGNETAFAVWRKGPGTDWTRIAVSVPNATTYADTGLAPLTGYVYRLRAIGAGGASAWTSEVGVTTPPLPPAAPGGLAVRVVTPTRLDVSWQDNSTNETAFALWRRTGAGDWTRLASLAPNVTLYNDTGAAPETLYAYRLRAINQGGASAWTAEVSATTPMAPPTDLVIRNGAPYLVYLEWADHSGSETGYELYRKLGNGDYGLLATLPANGIAYMDFALVPNTVHTYRVRAIGPNGPSGWSNEVRWTTPPAQ